MTWKEALEMATENGRKGFIVLAHPKWLGHPVRQPEWCWHAMRKGSGGEHVFRSTRRS